MDKYGIQIELLKEIDYLCRSNGLTYVLYKDIARIASENDCDRYNSIVVNIAMTRGEALKLRELINAQNREDRFLESIEDNENYLRWSIIYGDLNTTDFNLVKTKNQRNKGIHINIDFIENVHSRLNNGKIVAYKKLRQLTCVNKDEWSLWYIKAAARVSPILGKERIRNKYVSIRSDNDIVSWDDIKELETVSINNKCIPAKIFNSTTDINLMGHAFIIPSSFERYLEIIEARPIEKIRDAKISNNRIISTEIGFQEILGDDCVKAMTVEANKNYEVIVDKRKKNKKVQEKIKKLWKIVNDIVNSDKSLATDD